MAPKGQDREAAAPKPASWQAYFIIMLLALCCGFLAFNFHYILQASHIHITLAHHHRTTAFCAFSGCKLGGQGRGELAWSTMLARVLPTQTGHLLILSCCCSATDSDGNFELEAPLLDTPLMRRRLTPKAADAAQAAVIEALSARVCGSPAVDG